jgi:hypothetical protein
MMIEAIEMIEVIETIEDTRIIGGIRSMPATPDDRRHRHRIQGRPLSHLGLKRSLINVLAVWL